MKTEKPYFVMLNTQKGDYVPLMFEDLEMAQFETEKEANDCAKNTLFGETFGYEVFGIGQGL